MWPCLGERRDPSRSKCSSWKGIESKLLSGVFCLPFSEILVASLVKDLEIKAKTICPLQYVFVCGRVGIYVCTYM